MCLPFIVPCVLRLLSGLMLCSCDVVICWNWEEKGRREKGKKERREEGKKGRKGRKETRGA